MAEGQTVVVGGGVSGLTAARALRDRGVDVVVHEAGSRAGGVLCSERREGYLLEHAANAFLPAEDGAVELAEALGVETVVAGPAARRRWIFLGGRLRALPTSPRELVTTDLLSVRGKLSALAEPLRPPRPRPGESVGEFARRRLGDEAARAVVAPFVTGVFAGDADALSLDAAFPRLAALEREGGLVRGMIKRAWAGRRARGSARPRRLTAARDGAGAITEALARDLGDRLRCHRPVDSIARDGDGVVVVVSGERERFDAAVLAVPAPRGAAITRHGAPELADLLGSIPYAPIGVVHLGFRRDDVAHPLDGFGFLVAAGEPLRLLGCVFESVLFPGRAPEGEVLLRCIVGGARDPGILALSDDEISARVLADLGVALDLRAEPRLCGVVRHADAIAQYTAGHVERVERAESLAAEQRVVLAGAAYRGVAVNDCVAAAIRIAGRVGALAAAMILVFALAGCGAKGRPITALIDDGADPGTPADDAGLADEGRDPASADDLDDASALVVTPTWLWPPATLRQSPGRDACGVARRPPLSVHVMGGVHDTVVVVEGAPADRGPASLVVRGCRTEPAIVIAKAGGVLEVANGDETPRRVKVERLGASGEEEIASLPLRVAGQRYRVEAGEPGVLRVTTDAAGADPSYVVVTEFAAAVTDHRGVARFAEVPPGSYVVRAWHAPAGAAALSAETKVVIEAERTARAELDFAP